MDKPKTLIVVAGPTAVGKTAVSIALAQHFHCAIVSADSRQFYREMTIGTAKPSAEELKAAPHYFIDSLSIHDEYTVGDYEKDALERIEACFRDHNYCILTGGSGLFIDAVCHGMDEMPEIDPTIREKLNKQFEKEGIEPLLETLKRVDPDYYETVDKNNPRRIIRGLEVFQSSGKPYSSYRKKKTKKRPFNIIKIGLTMDREVLYKKIDTRMDLMLEAGLLEEAKTLLPYQHLAPLQTVGYQEIFDYLSGKYDWEEAVRLLKRNSRRYAKRQFTWFNKDTEIEWFGPEEIEGMIAYVEGTR